MKQGNGVHCSGCHAHAGNVFDGMSLKAKQLRTLSSFELGAAQRALYLVVLHACIRKGSENFCPEILPSPRKRRRRRRRSQNQMAKSCSMKLLRNEEQSWPAAQVKRSRSHLPGFPVMHNSVLSASSALPCHARMQPQVVQIKL